MNSETTTTAKDPFNCCQSLRERIERLREADLEMGIVRFIGYLLSRRAPEMDAAKLWSRLRDSDLDALIADLRPPERFGQGHAPGAAPIHFDDLYRRLVIEDELKGDRDKEILILCDTGHMSQVAAALLAEEKFTRAFSLRGGMEAWPYDLEKIVDGKLIRIEGAGEPPSSCCTSGHGSQGASDRLKVPNS